MTEDRAQQFLHLIRRSRRGKLKVYLGYGPGVGKTYLMLEEAHRLVRDGVDVAVGIVETHGRADTARLLEGLEIVPRRVMEYHGIRVEEMDLDAVLARKPTVALVDELAHTNAPGGRHGKRYEDVQEILDAGIHVIATLNVQHLESLYDTVEAMVGVKVRERIPDSVVADADQVVNVDLSPEDLQTRLREGKIYPVAQAGTALANFFTSDNLEHLRELTLREIASQIDFKRRDAWHERDRTAPDQVMVCLSSKGPHSARLLRFASRLAGRLNRNWYAVYVQTPSEDPTVIDATTQRILSDTLTLANLLGATVFTFKGTDVASTILGFAREYRVGHAVIGKPRPVPEWRRRLLGERSVAEELVQRAQGLTVVVVDTSAAEPETGEPAPDAMGVVSSPLLPTEARMTLSQALTPERVIFLDSAHPKDEVLDRLAQVAVANTGVTSAEVLASLRAREELGSTFLNEGIALPHTRVAGLTMPRAALAVCRDGISDAGTLAPIRFVFLLLDPPTPAWESQELLAQATKVFRDAARRGMASRWRDGQEVIAALRDSEGEPERE